MFLGVLVWTYSYLTSSLDYGIGNETIIYGFKDKDSFFFTALAIFILVNAVCMGFTSVLVKIKTTEEGVGIRNRNLKLDVIGWTKGFAAILNIMLSLTILFLVYLTFSEEYRIDAFFGYLVYLGPLLLAVWLGVLFKLIRKKRN